MNKKTLAVELSKLEKISSNNPKLEQYQTESETAASIIWKAFMDGNIEGKVIADFGCGNGIFGIGALTLGAKKVYFIDIDKNNINLAKKNCEFENAEFINSDIRKFNKKVDVILMNPPFGVQNEHADRVFLIRAMKISEVIYSIHKIESKKFVESLSRDNGFEVMEIIKSNFLLKKTMKFHKKNKYYIEVGCWVLKRKL